MSYDMTRKMLWLPDVPEMLVSQYLLVIGPVAPNVRCGVDEPSEVERQRVAPDGRHVPGGPRVLAPEVHRQPSRQDEAQDRHHD